jgi:hypothetical protein
MGAHNTGEFIYFMNSLVMEYSFAFLYFGVINTNVNGAASILRKSNHEFHLEEVAKGILTFPTMSTGKQNHIVVSSKNHASLAV